MGDFNAYLNGYTCIKPIDGRESALCEFTSFFNLFNVTTPQMCSSADSSYVSYDKRSSSLIDHIIVSKMCYRISLNFV